MKRKVIVPIILLLIVIIVGATFLFRGAGGNTHINIPESMRAYLGDSSNVAALELQGNVEVREVRMGFEVSGRISKIYVDEGNAIKPGQLLAELKPDYFEDALNQARASLQASNANLQRMENGSRPEEIEQARANTSVAQAAFVKAELDFNRANNLYDSGAVSQQVFDNAQAAHDQAAAQLKAARATQRLVEIGPRKEDIAQAKAQVSQAQAQVDDAQRRLDDTKLISPVAGMVQTRVHEAGDYVNTGEPINTITITDPVWVRAYVNETDLGNIYPGMKAIVRTDTDKYYPGQVGFISPVAEFTPKAVETKEIRTDLVYRIRVIAHDPKGELRQGMPVTVALILNSKGEK